MKNIAIVGATGIVGRTAIKILEERGLEGNNFFFFASSKSAGKWLKIGKKKIRVNLLDDNIFDGKSYDFALFCTKESLSEQFIPKFLENGAKVIDFSSRYRKDFPLIVPEINPEKAVGNLICNPNCSTAAAVMALYEIHKKFGLKEIIYSTYQAVSGAGKAALDEMKILDASKLQKFAYPICDNIIPQIGNIDERGFSTEENKMIFETRKILGDEDIKISATCVRVPIKICHSISIHFETRKNASLGQIKRALAETKGVKIFNDAPAFPMPYFTKGGNDVLVGRLRQSYNKNTFDIFVCSDNLRKGAAQNGVQILEMLMREEK